MKKILFVFLIAFSVAILVLTLRGVWGSPNESTLYGAKWHDDGPMEFSLERARFALMYSIVERNSVHLSVPLADFSAPDLASVNGKFVSLLAPGVSVLISLGYLIGKIFGLGQVGAYGTVAFFALLNTLLIYGICRKLGINHVAGILGAIVFLVGSPALPYAVSLYQHQISVFLLLLPIFALVATKSGWAIVVTAFCFTAALAVDNPNAVTFTPVLVWALSRLFVVDRQSGQLKVVLKLHWLIPTSVALVPLALFLYFNFLSAGDPLQLPGTLKQVRNARAKNAVAPLLTDRSVTNFFKTRHLLNGFYVHAISPDRGILVYSPVLLLGILGFWKLSRKRPTDSVVFVSTIGANIILYSMWGDPWGSWAFGSRYLIPSMAILAIGIGSFLSADRKNIPLLALFFVLFAYSVGVNILGALTTNRLPPAGEAKALEKISGLKQPYSIDRNWRHLNESGTKSFVYSSTLKNLISPLEYFFILSGAVSLVGLTLIIYLRLQNED